MAHLYAIQYREMKKNLSIEENFLEALKLERNNQKGFFKNIEIYHHLFFMLKYYSKNFLREVVDQYTENPHSWFYSFHKQFRQVDMFDGIGYFGRMNKEYHAFEMKEPFCGNMDMVMWETIANDSDNTLYRFMDEFIAMHFGVIGYEEKRLFPEIGEKNG